MNQNDFVRKLKAMRAEVSALKIAHERGLGVIDFYSKTITIPASTNDILVIAEAKDGQITPFFAQISLSDVAIFGKLLNTQANDSNIKWLFLGSDSAYNINIISSADILLSYEEQAV